MGFFRRLADQLRSERRFIRSHPWDFARVVLEFWLLLGLMVLFGGAIWAGIAVIRRCGILGMCLR